WALRFAQARAELSLARGDAEAAVRFADSAVLQARGRRPKYEVLGLLTRAAATSRGGHTSSALIDLREALRVARPVGDPALFLRPACALLAIDGDDALAGEARLVAESILARLPTHEMRERFRARVPLAAW